MSSLTKIHLLIGFFDILSSQQYLGVNYHLFFILITLILFCPIGEAVCNSYGLGHHFFLFFRYKKRPSLGLRHSFWLTILRIKDLTVKMTHLSRDQALKTSILYGEKVAMKEDNKAPSSTYASKRFLLNFRPQSL